MIRVLLKGHQQYYGFRSLLSMFAGSVQRIEKSVGGERLKGFAGEGPELWLLSVLEKEGPAIYRLEEEGGQLKKAACLEQAPPAPDLKRQLKRQFYRVLSQLTGIAFPWGSLTGIRPTYVASELLRESGREKSLQILEKRYGLKKEKAELALATAAAEEALLRRLPEKTYAAYIGVPFCPTRCAYCSFTTPEAVSKDPQKREAYLDLVSREIKQFEALSKGSDAHLKALYFGGGTPAALSEEELRRLLDSAFRLPLREDTEITFEAGRIDVLNEEKLKILAAYGIRNICLNPQSLNEATLRRVGREGSIARFFELFEAARRCGMKRINCDLIAGLDEDPRELISHVKRLSALGAESITLHTLALKRGSARDEARKAAGKDKRILPEQDLEEALHAAQLLLQEEGYRPYYLYRQKYGRGGLENTAFARPGEECVYNIIMMSDLYPVAGFGSPAVSKCFSGGKVKRLAAAKSLSAYLGGGERLLKKKKEFFSSAERLKTEPKAEGANHEKRK